MRGGKKTKIKTRYTVYFVIVTTLFVIGLLTNGLVMHPQIDTTNNQTSTVIIQNGNVVFAKLSLQNVPTVINGITASTSIIIAFIGVIIGLLYREVFAKEEKARSFLIYMSFLLVLPLAYLSSVYTFLITGWIDSALRIAMTGLFFSLFALVLVILFAGYRIERMEKTAKEKRIQ